MIVFHKNNRNTSINKNKLNGRLSYGLTTVSVKDRIEIGRTLLVGNFDSFIV